MAKPYTKELVERIIRIYCDGSTGFQVARELNCSPRTVYAYLRKYGVVRPSVRITQSISYEIVDRIVVKKQDVRDVSKMYNIDECTIYKHLEKLGIKLGSHGVRRNTCIKCNKELKPGDIYEKYKRVGNWTCKECEASRVLTKSRSLKQEIVKAYGGKCMCCDESHWQFLTVDHVNNDGAIQRLKQHPGSSFYYYLKRNGFPKDQYVLLCMNCNWCKGIFGHCAHIMDKQ